MTTRLDEDNRRLLDDNNEQEPGIEMSSTSTGAPAAHNARTDEIQSAQASEEPKEHDALDDIDGPSYSADHLAAVMKPVAVTMALASFVVANVQEPEGEGSISEGLNTYLVFNEDSGGDSGGGGGGGGSGGDGGSGGSSSPSGTVIGEAVINALVIVGVITVATFLMVLLYKYRCFKCMVGYLIFASAMLLGYSGGFVAFTAIRVYNIRIDWFTFVFLMYNFAIVGVIAVFWQKGVPRVVTQAYLVAVSIIMAWIVTKFPEWTSWALLIALALYDLCAVLTPCGPLRKLIELAQDRQGEPIPGLLYEADVGRNDGVDEADRQRQVRDTLVSHYHNAEEKERADSRGGARRSEADRGRIPPVENPIQTHAASFTTSQTSSSVSETTGATRSQESPSRVAPAPTSSTQHGREAEEAPESAEGQYIVEEFEEEDEEDRNVKLGLGDFVFYSVLVGRAALFDFATMVASYISILMVRCFVSLRSCNRCTKLVYSIILAIFQGLGMTLLLLGIFKKALPALPISIFLGVFFYFMTRILLVPYIEELSLNGISV
eukprot:gb/GECG01016301.1/.p1 GENE.gb/GECG01016301.1/~~gb/GECG01016301.1/.p1  ORF type:complete len:548 (+),score=64.56 gb/GECG01016301.1/:1-1644(+)